MKPKNARKAKGSAAHRAGFGWKRVEGANWCTGDWGIRQATQATAGFERYAKTTQRAVFLSEMERVVPGPALSALIEPFYPKPPPRSVRSWLTAGATRTRTLGPAVVLFRH